MKHASLPLMKSLIASLLAVCAFASASEAAKPAKADLAKGEALYTNGDSGRNLPSCLSCHGAAGNSTIAQNPKLAGLGEAYLRRQLVGFKGPERNQAVMTPFAKLMTDAEVADVSAYLAAQTQKAGAAKNKGIVEAGKKIFRGGIAEKNVPACASCHSATGAGIPALYPRLAGQHQDYTVAQMAGFRAGTRKNSPEMTAIAARMSDDEMKAVADYVAGLK